MEAFTISLILDTDAARNAKEKEVPRKFPAQPAREREWLRK
jgi:hypothetical protein